MIEKQLPDDHHEYFYSVSEVCKYLGLRDEKGKLIGRNKFFICLRNNHILLPNNEPYQNWLKYGWCIYHRTTKRYKSYFTTMFSERGLNHLKSGFDTQRFIVDCREYNKRKTLSVDDVC